MLDYMETILKKIETLESRTYTKPDLGMSFKQETYTFKVWSPLAKEVLLNVYETGDVEENSLIKQLAMTQKENVWTIDVTEDMNGLFYTYSFDHGDYQTEAPDLYSKAVGINGDRTAIIHLNETNPDNWEHDEHVMQKNITDAMIWEVHVEDFSSDAASGIQSEYQGKYLGFTEEDTTLYNAGEFPTGLNYLKQLGVNYVHLLPIYDFVNDEEDKSYYNWGYDPKNYMAPEGKYSSDPRDPKARIKELKQLIQSLHKHNIGVVMDVVYNHTFHTEDSWFQFTVPDYYYRQDDQGNFSNGSGVGNETASERTMMRKYMIDSLLYWVEEYHIDGFRFDLMGVHDTETMNEIRKALDENGYEDVILYGEPWAGGELSLKEPYKPADRNHVHDYSEDIALFNAEFRDAIKGHVFLDYDAAFLQGANNDHSSNFQNEDLIAALMANTQSDAGEYKLPEYKVWARSPKEVVNYSSAHDNFTLYDKLVLSTDSPTKYSRQEHLVAMNKINAALLFTAQGGIFLQAGEEFARTKHGNPNTYNASIAINHLDWSRAAEFDDLIAYYRGMMAIRKAYPPLRDETTRTANMTYFRRLPENVMAYTIPNVIDEQAKWDNFLVVVNTGDQPQSFVLPTDPDNISQEWTILANIKQASADGLGTIRGESIILNPREVYVLAIER
jgi:pullulanase